MTIEIRPIVGGIGIFLVLLGGVILTLWVYPTLNAFPFVCAAAFVAGATAFHLAPRRGTAYAILVPVLVGVLLGITNWLWWIIAGPGSMDLGGAGGSFMLLSFFLPIFAVLGVLGALAVKVLTHLTTRWRGTRARTPRAPHRER